MKFYFHLCLIIPISLASGCLAGSSSQSRDDQVAQNRQHFSVQEQTDIARQDISARLGIAETQVTVIDARQVIWPDTSVGCAQPGYAYPQMLTAGIRIELLVGGEHYHYHAGNRGPVQYCQNPSAKKPQSRYEDR